MESSVPISLSRIFGVINIENNCFNISIYHHRKKTILTISISKLLNKLGQRVLMLDTEPQNLLVKKLTEKIDEGDICKIDSNLSLIADVKQITDNKRLKAAKNFDFCVINAPEFNVRSKLVMKIIDVADYIIVVNEALKPQASFALRTFDLVVRLQRNKAFTGLTLARSPFQWLRKNIYIKPENIEDVQKLFDDRLYIKKNQNED